MLASVTFQFAFVFLMKAIQSVVVFYINSSIFSSFLPTPVGLALLLAIRERAYR